MNAPAAIAPASAGHFTRVTPGPMVGVPPSVEQVPVDRLTVDPAYQRAIDGAASRRIIVGMVRQWDWSLCLPLVVSRRPDGSLLILDGQHRHAGAVERGDIPYLPCVIQSSLDVAGEARVFVELNTKRQRLTQAEIFNGMLAAGDEQAKTIADMIAATGWNVRRTSNTANYKPGDLECAPMLVRALANKAIGENAVRFALTALRAAYPDAPVRHAATLLKALFEVFDAMAEAGVATADLITAIGAVPSDNWLSRGILHRNRYPALSHINAIAATMIAAAQGKDVPTESPVTTRAVNQPEQFAENAKKSPAPAVTTSTNAVRPLPVRVSVPAKAKSPFGTADKGWCEQCDQLRSKAAAAACASRFCKLRPFT
ncbi:hypothetical protein [Novosphingobium olei]|uniref:hypothetical protein n=1 Tax=Novosphingobium olei TaxID=2728851 RepID=UPI003092E4B2|nr:hypothetical protein NSDW_33270 [Novosphingobium olei]